MGQWIQQNSGGLEDRMSRQNGVMNESTGYIKTEIEVSNKPYKCKYAKGMQKSPWCYKVCPDEASDITQLLALMLLQFVVAQVNPAPFCSWMICLVTPKQKLCNKKKQMAANSPLRNSLSLLAYLRAP